jgi:hypothetical protein
MPKRHFDPVTHNNVETAIREGIPFAINMADGRQYEVRDSLKVALGKTHVVVIDTDDCPHVLPLLTMTGISYLPKQNGSAAA